MLSPTLSVVNPEKKLAIDASIHSCSVVHALSNTLRSSNSQRYSPKSISSMVGFTDKTFTSKFKPYSFFKIRT